MPEPDWMPAHYTELQEVCLTWNGSQRLSPMDCGISISANPTPHVRLLSSAASKFRLARFCQGLLGPDKKTIISEGIGRRYFERYSAQAIVMLAFVALETHLRMLGTDWRSYQLSRTGIDLDTISVTLRADFEKADFEKLIRAMDKKPLRKRLEKFWEGDSQEILAAVSAIRNSFSHGKMGVSKSISLQCADSIRDFLLELVERDTQLIVRALRQQDSKLLASSHCCV